MKTFLAALFALAGLFCSSAHAQTGVSRSYTGCLTRAGKSTVQKGMCAQAELTRQDARLNRAYHALMLRSDHEGNTEAHYALRNGERTWIHDRDRGCKLNDDTVDNGCLVKRTAARADELEARLRP